GDELTDSIPVVRARRAGRTLVREGQDQGGGGVHVGKLFTAGRRPVQRPRRRQMQCRVTDEQFSRLAGLKRVPMSTMVPRRVLRVSTTKRQVPASPPTGFAPPQSQGPNPEASARHACPPAHPPGPTHVCVAPGTQFTRGAEAGGGEGGGGSAPGGG